MKSGPPHCITVGIGGYYHGIQRNLDQEKSESQFSLSDFEELRLLDHIAKEQDLDLPWFDTAKSDQIFEANESSLAKSWNKFKNSSMSSSGNVRRKYFDASAYGDSQKHQPFRNFWRNLEGLVSLNGNQFGSYAMLVRSAAIVNLIYLLIYLLFYIGSSKWLTPVAAVFSLVSFATGSYGFFVLVEGSWGLLVLFFLGLLLLGGLPRYKYRIRYLWSKNNESAIDFKYNKPTYLTNQDDEGPRHLISPIERFNAGPDSQTVFVICAEGGGIKAAAWSYAVLRYIESVHPKIASQIKFITGASGGMLGASYYVAGVSNNLPFDQSSEDGVSDFPHSETIAKLYKDAEYENITKDMLTPVISRLVTYDLPLSLFSPFPLSDDRGQVLEKTWHKNLDGRLSIPFSSLRQSEREGWRPSLIFTPMLVEDGRRLVISNIDVSSEIKTHSPGASSVSGFQLSKLFPATEVSLATAARLNASFPYISPAAYLPTLPRRRVVDAGYSDNYGIHIAANLIQNQIDELMKSGKKIVLIRIAAGRSLHELQLGAPGEERKRNLLAVLGDATSGLTGPVKAVLASRQAVTAYRNNELLSRINEQMGNSFEVCRFELTDDLPLSWYLSEQAKVDIVECLEASWNTEARKQVRKWQL